MMEYDKEELTQTISTEELIRHFRNEEEVSGYCRECENFGKSWGCPPFDFDVEDRLKQYKEVLLVATKITPKEQGLPLNAAQELILPERRRIDKRLLELEKEHSGLPCRHPHLVRPSLEAYGFDVALISQELFGIKLRWGKDGLLPEYLVIVCALFYNIQKWRM